MYTQFVLVFARVCDKKNLLCLSLSVSWSYACFCHRLLWLIVINYECIHENHSINASYKRIKLVFSLKMISNVSFNSNEPKNNKFRLSNALNVSKHSDRISFELELLNSKPIKMLFICECGHKFDSNILDIIPMFERLW